MADYQAPLNDANYLLQDVFKLEQFWAELGYDEVNLELASAVLDEAGKITRDVLAPLNREGDEEGCKLVDQQVQTPKGFKEAYQQLMEGGWLGLGGNPEFGGQGMPKSLSVLFEEMLYSANTSLALYGQLTAGACLALDAHASEAMKQKYLPAMYEGRWAGSMNLTEPHCGTDLGLLRTKAVEQQDGSYLISGTKIFITGGDQDLSENLIHLVLARLPDAPAGVKGISLFVVPKFMVNDDGSLAERNQAYPAALEHKMGIKGSATCVMNFDSAVGYLVGEANKGLNYMFTMMNYERLTIGLQGVGQAEWSYQQSLAYAKDRVQSKATNPEFRTEGSADPIIVHADVRRMLLTQKVLVESARALAVYMGMQLDAAKKARGSQQEQAASHVALLTPVVKAFFTDRGLDGTLLGQMVFGGHGYIREWGMEQAVRDVRIAQIYEGTNGIQAMDLIGRKVFASKGQLLEPYLAEIESELSIAHLGETETEAIESCLQSMRQHLSTLSTWDGDKLGTQAVAFLDWLGYLSYAYMWLKMSNNPPADVQLAAAKKVSADWFFAYVFPQWQTEASRCRVESSLLYNWQT
jgi:alkylation response protein AidB-like acyl-CoA dehydrogenase